MSPFSTFSSALGEQNLLSGLLEALRTRGRGVVLEVVTQFNGSHGPSVSGTFKRGRRLRELRGAGKRLRANPREAEEDDLSCSFSVSDVATPSGQPQKKRASTSAGS
jgi:hypothetical protein